MTRVNPKKVFWKVDLIKICICRYLPTYLCSIAYEIVHGKYIAYYRRHRPGQLKGKTQSCSRWKTKKATYNLHGSYFSINMAKFRSIHWNKKLISNLFFSEEWLYISQTNAYFTFSCNLLVHDLVLWEEICFQRWIILIPTLIISSEKKSIDNILTKLNMFELLPSSLCICNI